MLRLVALFMLAGCSSSSPAPIDGGDDGGGQGGMDAAAVPDAEVEPEPEVDAGPQTLRERCFPELGEGAEEGPDYDQFAPVVGSHCSGTNHQDVAGIERVVFLGDSITEGTPPTPNAQFYRNLLADSLRAKFGEETEVGNCSDWGARTDDLLLEPHQQIIECFPEPEPRPTLVVMTVGGNDMSAIAQDAMDGASTEETAAAVDEALRLLREAIDWLKEDPARFPGGVFVAFANVYEFTDGTGDLPSCPGAALAGFDQPWPEGRDAFLHMNEGMMQIAVETGTDMIFLLETFCGHGFHADDPDSPCYRGPDTQTWFDFTCIHPNPTGHGEIARMFMDIVDE